MRQLGGHELEQYPGRSEPSEQEPLAGGAIPPPTRNQRGDDEERTGPEAWHGRRAVRFLRPDQFWQEIAQYRVGDEPSVGRVLDRDDPGTDNQQHHQDAGDWPQLSDPAAIAISD